MKSLVLFFVVFFAFVMVSAQSQKVVYRTKQKAEVATEFKTIRVGNQIWMAENLDVPARKSWYYECKESFGKKYGRLYTWEAAKNACPVGWHLPTMDEWKQLFDYVGGEEIAGKRLKLNGSSGFNANLGGMASLERFMLEGSFGTYWTASNYDKTHAWYVYFTQKNDYATLTYFTKDYGFYVRCIKNK